MSKNNSLNETSTWRVGRKENPVKDSKKKQVRRDTGQSDPFRSQGSRKDGEENTGQTVRYREVRYGEALTEFIEPIFHVLIT